MLVASTSFLDNNWNSFFQVQRPETARETVRAIRQATLHDSYKSFYKNPEPLVKRLTFDEITKWMDMFHLIRPIMVNQESIDCITRLLDLLNNNGIKTVKLAELERMGNAGLVSCTCDDYLMRAWCKHSFCFAKRRNIIKDYPPTMHPKPSIRRSVSQGKKRGPMTDNRRSSKK